MNKIIYAAPVFAALAFSNVASAAGNAPTFSIPTFYQDVTTLVGDFTSFEGDVGTLYTDTQQNYTSSITSYQNQLGLYDAGFSYCLKTPSPCSQAEVTIAQNGQNQVTAANNLLNALPSATQVESNLGNINAALSTMDTNDVKNISTSLGTVNGYASQAQTYAEQLAASNPTVSATFKAKAAALAAKK